MPIFLSWIRQRYLIVAIPEEQAAVMNWFLLSSALGGMADRETLADILEAIVRRIEGEGS